MATFYLDAEPLVWWALSTASPPHADSDARGVIPALIQATDNVVAASEVSLAEFQSKLCRLVRNTEASARQFDAHWLDAVMTQLMTWIADRRLSVLQFPPNAFEMAMMHVAVATREHSRNFEAWDAVHLACAVHWARSLNETVGVVTRDAGFRNFVEIYPGFRRWVEIVHPDKLAVRQ
jgi:hypothetical protein